MDMDYGDVFEPLIDEYGLDEKYKQQLNQVVEKFVGKHSDRNTRLSKEEMSEVIENKKYLEDLFETYDRDGDGLSLEEYMEDWFTKRVVEYWKQCFAEYDYDESGTLDGEEEIENFIASLGFTGRRGRDMKKKLDEDNDGSLSMKEFEDYAKEKLRKQLSEKCNIFYSMLEDDMLTKEADLGKQ
ncbi:uncharacterized protein LOC141912266 [Tubulanus polymorphus]|uniref:uncharacterized protein LOC141912266 n=1 Tax=Tubulanus polymorphus TaxID=672921 RepID=UPI003DA389A9